MFKITHPQSTTQCKMKYIIHLFNADKQPLTYKNGKIEVESLETDLCDHDLYKHLYYVNVQAKWQDNEGPKLEEYRSVKGIGSKESKYMER